MERLFAIVLLSVGCILALPCLADVTESPASAGPKEALESLAPADWQNLWAVRESLLTIEELLEQGVISEEQADVAAGLYRQRLDALVGDAVTVEELMDQPPEHLSTAFTESPTSADPTLVERVTGFITFINILWVIAILIGAFCLFMLFGEWFAWIFHFLKYKVPVWCYVALVYGFAYWVWHMARGSDEVLAPFFGFFACLLLAIAVYFHAGLQWFKRTPMSVWLLLYALIVGFVAIDINSVLIAWLAVISLFIALGFSVLVGPLVVCFGFESRTKLASATVTAFVILIFYTLLQILATSLPGWLMVFEPPAMALGTFVGFSGLLIVSSRYYTNRRWGYGLLQLITVVTGVLALAVGSIFSIDPLQKIGGTFFVIYVLQKITEIPFESELSWLYTGLLLSVACSALAVFLKLNPDLVAPYLYVQL